MWNKAAKSKSKDIKKTVLLLSCLPVLALFGQCFAADKYVATYGSDSNTGTATNDAWLTIGKALTSAISGDILHVDAGTYILTQLILGTSSFTLVAVGHVDINSTSTSSLYLYLLRQQVLYHLQEIFTGYHTPTLILLEYITAIPVRG